jgi:tripartite-type tricarboxylate transporter receptor subunit TctC
LGTIEPAECRETTREETMPTIRRASLAALAAAIVVTAAPATAQTPEQFYTGKTIDLVIGYPPAGSNDVWGRLLARHIGKHIPGKPNVVPKNMPGAGSFLAVNTIYNVSPKDGTVIGIGAPTTVLDEKLGSQGVRFKTAELNWIGRGDSLINMIFMWKTSPVQSIEDALKTEATLAGTGAGSTVSIYPTVMNNVFKTKFKLIMGYRGSNDAMLAVERGETEGHSTSWLALKVAHPDWIRDKKVKILVQFSLKRHPEMADVPTIVDMARSDEERRMLSAIVAAAEIGTAFFTTPGVPADRLAVLRSAFDATMKDPEFLAEARKLTLSVNPMTGQDLQKMVSEVADMPPDLLEKVRVAYTTGN